MSNADRPAAYQEQGKAAQVRANASAIGEHDDRGLVHDDFRPKAAYHAFRILSGSHFYQDVEGFWTIRTNGALYHLAEKQFDIVKRISDSLNLEYVKEEGILHPFSVDNQITLIDKAIKRANIEMEIKPNLLRVMFIRMDQGGCGWYRIIQPVRWLQILGEKNETVMHVEETNFVSYPMLCNCDIIVVPRQCSYQTLAVMQALKRAGKIVVYETDDLLNNIPDWNPAKGIFTEHDLTQRRDMIMKLSDNFIVSTPELKESIGNQENSMVVNNGIDHRMWPMQIRDFGDQRVNILWAGSDTHSRDLAIVVKVIKRIISEFKGKVMFTFVGYMPDEFRVLQQRGNEIGHWVKDEWKRDIRFFDGCPVQAWPQLLASTNADICLAPLVECEFNRCKSELKVLESWALGCPIVASDIAPYRRAVTHGENGFLCRSDEEWHTHIRTLIMKKEERQRMGGNGIGTLKRRYTMDKVVYQMESALLQIALGRDGIGRIPRKECNDTIKQRIEDMKFEGIFATGENES